MLPVIITVAAILLLVGGVYAFSLFMQSENGQEEISDNWREHWPHADQISKWMQDDDLNDEENDFYGSNGDTSNGGGDNG